MVLNAQSRRLFVECYDGAMIWCRVAARAPLPIKFKVRSQHDSPLLPDLDSGQLAGSLDAHNGNEKDFFGRFTTIPGMPRVPSEI